MVLFIVELSVTFSVEKNATLNTTLISTNLDTLSTARISYYDSREDFESKRALKVKLRH